MSDLIYRQNAIDAMCSACGYDCDKSEFVYNAPQDEQVIMCPEHYASSTLPSAEPKQSIAEWQKDFREYINMLNIPRDDYNGLMEYIDEVPFAQQCMTATSNTMVSETVKIPVMDGTTERLPSVEPERKKGKWIQPCDITGFGRCSSCNALWDNSLIENRYFRYCPRCGAVMREGEEDETD